MREAPGGLPQFIFDMRFRTFLLAVLLLNACFTPSQEPEPDAGALGGGTGGGTAASGGGLGGGAGGGSAQRCEELIHWNETVCVELTPVICSGQTCASGEVCCQTTGACVAAGAQCPNPTSTAPNDAKSCGSNADCSSDEFCRPDDPSRCIAGSGHCVMRNNCGYCSPAGSPFCEVCGCNGVTYESIQAACVAGISYTHRGACGASPPGARPEDVACGRADQCPMGSLCCFRTGTCYSASEPWRCEEQPDGSILNCTTDSECNRGGSGGGSGSTDGFCGGGDTCGNTPGLCLSRGSASSCGGQVRSVCGCDGNTYVNDCWARVGGTRVAHEGPCP